MGMKNVLVFPCGAQPAIDINIAMRGNGEYKIFGASGHEDHGAYIYENYIPAVPFIYEENFIPRFNELLNQYNIHYIIPVHDSMVLFLQEHASEINSTVVSSCYETALLCRYKSKTYKALEHKSFVPKVYAWGQELELPVFIKKDDDQGARQAYKVETVEELLRLKGMRDMIICQYLPGEELTVDCFTDRHGSLRFCSPRTRERILAGITVHARVVELSQEVLYIASELNKEISFRGYWFFQIKKASSGSFKLLEVSTRFAGGFSLSRCKDINLPLMVLKDFEQEELDFCHNEYPLEADRMLFSRYRLPYEYNRIVIDGIETFINDGIINTFFMMFIYQCINKKKAVILLVEDEKLWIQRLSELKLSSSIFSSIVVEKDYSAIDYREAVFISKNLQRRNMLRREQKAFCLEPSAVELLVDWKA